MAGFDVAFECLMLCYTYKMQLKETQTQTQTTRKCIGDAYLLEMSKNSKLQYFLKSFSSPLFTLIFFMEHTLSNL